MFAIVASAAMVASAATVPTSKEISPGVFMPYINLGGVHTHPSNYSAWLDLGGVGLDTALMYGDDVQLHVGDAIAAHGRPDTLFVTTKVPCCPEGTLNTSWCAWYDSEYADLDAGTRGDIDLRLLGVDKVDLMLLHWPCQTMEQTIATYRALEDFQLAGKATNIGISNFNSTAIKALYAAGLRVPPVVNQCGFSIAGHSRPDAGRDFETLAECKRRNITYSAYSPLGGLSKIPVLSNPTVKAVAAAHNKSTAQVALRWVTQQEVTAVTASDNVDHLKGDLDIFDFTLTDDEMKELSAL